LIGGYFRLLAYPSPLHHWFRGTLTGEALQHQVMQQATAALEALDINPSVAILYVGNVPDHLYTAGQYIIQCRLGI
jgi:cytochrome c-type biogenesis protein CcmE